MKKLIEQHYQVEEVGQRKKFRRLAPKANHIFLDYLTELSLVLDNSIKSANASSFEDLRSLLKVEVLASIPSRFSNYLIEKGVENQAQLERRGTAFYDANKAFAGVITAELFIIAASTFHNIHKYGNAKSKKVSLRTSKSKAPWHGKFSDCKFVKLRAVRKKCARVI